MNKQFKIIAIKPLEGCASYILKRLQRNRLYYLCNGYEISEHDIKIVGKDILDNNFFQIEEGKPYINISAIVGKNGDGKSSLIELMIRILNNIGKLLDFENKNETLSYVRGVCGEVYYSILENDKEYTYRINSTSKNGINILKIKDYSTSKELTVYVDDEGKPILNDSVSRQQYEYLLEKMKASFFYTIVSNYSLYSYNVNELSPKEGEWIKNVFHKNDSYQTPIVLHPYRNNGNIDVNNEYYLSLQRLLYLFSKYESFRSIGNQKVELLALKRVTQSKLLSDTFKRYFESIKSKNLLNKEIELIKGLDKQSRDEYLEGILKILDNDIFIKVEELTLKGEGVTYKNSISDIEILLNNLNYRGNIPIKLNVAQYQRIILVQELSDLLLKKSLNSYTDFKYQDFHYWQNNNNPKPKSERQLTCEYILYKIIHIFERYPEYKGILDMYENQCFFLYQPDNVLQYRKNELERGLLLVEKGIREKSHITLKLRQAINYLKNIDKEITYFDLEEETKKSLSEFEIIKKKTIGSDSEYLISLDILKDYLELEIETTDRLELLPPRIFDTEIYIKQQKDNEYTPLSLISSGERQMLYVISSIIYHLQNLNSVSGDLIKYNNVNIVLEEVELYFHPEYQRQFIKYLIDTINKSNLSHETCINLTFVTHSPFILSDIPKQNVLFLKDGIPNYDMQENTFGANIYDLLHCSFFLEEYSGDLALIKIKNLIDEINSIQNNASKFKVENIEQKIKLVGEPFIRTQLYRTLYEIVGDKDKFKIIELRTELEELEKRIKND
ncbi:AAA family ATPase [Dysgonomonas sp. BGC7]|uniref:AAA family ATPase n=1 Tax=Dysgonomonas sp. BGC7 TaxID=1658008 RepID=UPI0006810544|nr:AAA family ATPase [Dysgonomonas sp. BGC7]MBD8388350.1 AAA family ATPase [Dysgonomonas sp. BGC7]